MLLASAPSREWSLLSSRPTSRAHDKSLCQGDPTGREAALYRLTLHEWCKLPTYLGSVHIHWPRGFLTCSWGLVLLKSSCRPGLDRHSSTGANTLSLRGNISMLSWVLMYRTREQRDVPQARQRDKQVEEGGRNAVGVFLAVRQHFIHEIRGTTFFSSETRTDQLWPFRHQSYRWWTEAHQTNFNALVLHPWGWLVPLNGTGMSLFPMSFHAQVNET